VRYRTIVADPPWAPGSNGKANPRRHYNVMQTEDIAALPVSDLAEQTAHLWCWAINSMVEDAYQVVRAWGFTPITMITWCKKPPGVGVYLRNNTEHCILAKRGATNLVPAAAASATWFIWPRGEHSKKPDAFYDIVETVSPGPYLELFARRQRLGWDTWGNEALEHVEFVPEAESDTVPGEYTAGGQPIDSPWESS
jgi:N6-adenosine-specific RNA methylase IME4